MKIIKKIIYFSFLTFLLFSFFTINSYALDEYSDNTQNNKIENGFDRSNDKLYYYENGIAMTGVFEDNNTWYYVSEDGNMKQGWIFYNDNWYYVNKDATLKTGWFKYYGKWYYLEKENTSNPCSAICNDSRVINNIKYFFDENCAQKISWIQDGMDWYYFDSAGAMKTGWLLDHNHWYLLGTDGKMLTGWQSISGKKYYLDETGSGRMITGWVFDDNSWYYMRNSGEMTYGWQKVKNQWYYMNNLGIMQTGWIRVSNEWYYLKESGAMATGWLKDNGNWYYLNSSGEMLHDKYFEAYYLTSNGVLANDNVYNNLCSRAQRYSSSTQYLILADTSNCRVAIFQKATNSWSNIHYYKCAPGKASTPTVKGEFTVGAKGYYFDSGQSRCFWYTQFYHNYLFHSTLYNKNGTIQDNRTGIPLSHGCIRLEIQYAKWIYDNIPKNTKVIVF